MEKTIKGLELVANVLWVVVTSIWVADSVIKLKKSLKEI